MKKKTATSRQASATTQRQQQQQQPTRLTHGNEFLDNLLTIFANY
jgi:hypothetical protein